MTETKNQAGAKSGNRTRQILADWLVAMRRRQCDGPGHSLWYRPPHQRGHRRNIGASDRLDFTVIRPDVNLVSRLETIASESAPPIALSESFAAFCSRPLRSLGTRRFEGMEEPREVFTLHQGN